MINKGGKFLFIFYLLFFLAACGIHENTEVQEEAVFAWTSSAVEYKMGGSIAYTESRIGYGDATGIYDDVECWKIYIANAELGDVEGYISQLKSNGFSFFSFDPEEGEPNIEFIWPGYFLWNGTSDICIVKIILSEDKLEMVNKNNNETFNYNLSIEIINDNVWRMQEEENKT